MSKIHKPTKPGIIWVHCCDNRQDSMRLTRREVAWLIRSMRRRQTLNLGTVFRIKIGDDRTNELRHTYFITVPLPRPGFTPASYRRYHFDILIPSQSV